MSIAVTERPMTNSEYHEHAAISNTKLKVFAESRRLYRALHVDRTLRKEQTPDMLLGSVTHALTFEPEQFKNLYAVAPKCDRRTKEGKQVWADFCASVPPTADVVTADIFDQARYIHDGLWLNPVASQLLSLPGNTEVPLFWTDANTGLACRCKLDKMATGTPLIVDLKVTNDVTPEAFAKSVAKFRYDGQNAFYEDGYEANFGKRPKFIFIAAQKTPPYEVGFYELDEADVLSAREVNSRLMSSLRQCMESNDWGSPHERDIVQIKLPRFAAYRDEYQTY